MSLVAIDSSRSSARAAPIGVAQPKWVRSLKALLASGRHALREEWPNMVASHAFQMLLRAGGVALLLAVLLFVAVASQPDEDIRPARPARVARMAVSPVVSLARQPENLPLDSDFSVDEAALTWAHRLGSRGGPEIETPGILRFGSVRVAQSVAERVVQAAKSTDIDPALLMAIADKESSFSASAKASTSSASGLFQFVEKTWLKALKTFGWRYGRELEAAAIRGDDNLYVTPDKRQQILNLRNDPYLSAALAAEMLKKDGDKIAQRLGRSLTAGETYLIHFLGPEDAARFMEKKDAAPQSSAAELLPKPARANRPIFYEKLGGGRTKTRSVGEVHEAFEHMMGTRANRYQDVESRLPQGVAAYAEGRAR
jgi:hypothetical protein